MQMAEQVVSGVQAYCLCDWALHPVCWSMLAAAQWPRNGRCAPALDNVRRERAC